MCSGTQLQVVTAVADSEVGEVNMAGAADRRGAVRSRCNRFRAGTASTLQFPDLRRCTHRRLTKSRRCQSRGRHHPLSAGRGVAEGKGVVPVAGVGLVEAGMAVAEGEGVVSVAGVAGVGLLLVRRFLFPQALPINGLC
jgi:hypothetical protein